MWNCDHNANYINDTEKGDNARFMREDAQTSTKNLEHELIRSTRKRTRSV